MDGNKFSMVRLIQLLFVVSLLAIASIASAQTPLPACPRVKVEGLSEADQGTIVVFTAIVVEKNLTTKPEFKWQVSAGTITSGQGTDTISVETAGLGGVDLIATVELSTAPPGCKGTSSRPTKIKATITCWLAFDEYGDISFEDEKSRLDNFAIQIANEPQASGAILMFAGQETFKNETAQRLARARSWLTDVRHTDPKRILTFDCGFTQELTITLWVVPDGLAPPGCASYRALPLSKVKFTKPRPKSAKRRR